MNRVAHLSRLVTELSADGRYATGQRRFLRTVTRDDAADIAGGLYEELDRAGALRLEAAARQGMTIACARGCTACCEELVLAHAPEVAAVTRWLTRPEQAKVRAAFMAAYPAWRAAVGDAPDRLSALWAGTDFAAYKQAHREQAARHILCAFNRDGACTIYEVRPIVCRNAHALETSAHCNTGDPATPPPQSLSCPPYDQFVVQVQTLVHAVHHAAGQYRQPPVALCDAVYAALAAVAEG